MLHGVDDIDWAVLDRAYHDPADDVASRLRAIASSDADEASDARAQVGDWIIHQGTVYQTTEAAVPFLVELAECAVHAREEILWLAVMVAEQDPEIRAALATTIDRLARLAADASGEMRGAAVCGLALVGGFDLLWDRWAAEADADVRCALAVALAHEYPERAAPMLAGPDRLGAAVGLARAGRAVPDAVLAELLVAGAVPAYPPWSYYEETLSELLGAASDMTAVLDPAALPEKAMYAMQARCEASRSAPATLIGMLGPALDGPHRRTALSTLLDCGVAAAVHVDVLARIAAVIVPGPPPVGPDKLAIRILGRLAHPGWVTPMCTRWAAGVDIDDVSRWYRPIGPDLLDAVADRLRPDAPTRVLAGLARFAAKAGPAAHALADPLRAARSTTDAAILGALVAIGAADERELRDASLLRHRYQRVDVDASVALAALTGDTGPLRAALADRPDDERALRSALPVADRMEAGFFRRYADGDPELAVAAARCALRAGDPSPAAAAIRRGLADTRARAYGEAIALIAELGEPQFDPILRHAAAHGNVEAAEALVARGADPTEYTEVVEASLRATWTVDPDEVVRQIVAMRAQILAQRLASADDRTITGGETTSIIWEDELMRDALARAATSQS